MNEVGLPHNEDYLSHNVDIAVYKFRLYNKINSYLVDPNIHELANLQAVLVSILNYGGLSAGNVDYVLGWNPQDRTTIPHKSDDSRLNDLCRLIATTRCGKPQFAEKIELFLK